MRILLIAVLLGVSTLACVAQPAQPAQQEPDPGQVSETEQTICNPDLDNCPGGHAMTLRQRTELEQSDAAQGATPISASSTDCGQYTTGGGAIHNYCSVTWDMGGYKIKTVCEECIGSCPVSGVQCSSTVQ